MSKFIHLPQRALLLLKGAENASLLQGLITNDIRNLTETKAIASFVLNTKGRIVEDLVLYKRDEDILVECGTKSRADLKALLEKYRLRKKVDITESEESVYFTTENSGIQDPRVPTMGYRFIGKEESAGQPEYYLNLRLSLGVAEGKDELDGLLPYQANGDALCQVSLDKGCYIGQELTARTAHTGVIRRRLLPFQSDSEVKGDVVDSEGRTVGHTVICHETRGIALLSLNAVNQNNRKLSVNGVPVRPFQPTWLPDRLFAPPDKKK